MVSSSGTKRNDTLETFVGTYCATNRLARAALSTFIFDKKLCEYFTDEVDIYFQ